MTPGCSENGTSCLQWVQNAIELYDNNIQATKKPLISDSAKRIIEITIHITLFITTSFFGIITNVINITVYSKQGLKDSITLGFFALSISDLFLVTMSLVTACCYLAKAILPDSNIDFSAIHYVSSSSCRNMGYSISSVFTAFLSLERCCCVVLPFKVKLIFTRSRTAVILTLILMFHVVCYVPFFASQVLRWTPYYVSPNGTVAYRLKIRFSYYRPIVERFNYIAFGIVTPTICQAVVTVCAVILTNGLRASSNFRQAMRQAKVMESNLEAKVTNGDAEWIDDGNADFNGNLSKKEARPIKAMIFLVAIMSMSNIPYLMITYAKNIVPELTIGGAYHNTYSTCFSVVYTLSSLNASLNIFVYYNASAKYKEIVRSLFDFRISK